MSITLSAANKALEKIAKAHNLNLSDIQKLVASEIPQPSPWASGKAKELALSAGVNPYDVTGTGDKGKITLDDIRGFLGQEVKAKIENLFASKAARELAEENKLTQADFLVEERNGSPRKSGNKTIRISDVKKKLGLEEKKSVSPKKSKSPEKKKITKKDVKKAIKVSEKVSENSDEEN